jgi:hypothetical protein
VLGICAPQSMLVGADEVIEQDTIAAVHESVVGTNAKCRLLRAMSEFEGKAEDKCSY